MVEIPKPRDESGRFMSSDDVVRYRSITVWDDRDGNIPKCAYDATDKDLREIEEYYDEPYYTIQVEEIGA